MNPNNYPGSWKTFGDGLRAAADGAYATAADLRHEISIHDLDMGRGKELNILSPYSTGDASSNSLMHPTVLYVPGGVDGSRFLMVVTPFPGAYDGSENPCIYVSDDLKTWRTPLGVSNPVVKQPPAGYNSDNAIYLHTDGFIYMIWRKRVNGSPPGTGSNTIYGARSPDGISWSDPVTLLVSTDTGHDWASPSFWHDGSNWIMISHNILHNNDIEALAKTGDFLVSWQAITPVVVTITHPSGLSFWHSDVRRLPSGRLIGLALEGGPGGGIAQGPGGGSAAWLWQSDDNGTTWSVRQLTRGKINYRSSLVIRNQQVWILLVWIDADVAGTPLSTEMRLHSMRPGRIERRRAQAQLQSIVTYGVSIQDEQSILTLVDGFAGSAADLTTPWVQETGSALRRNGSGFVVAATTSRSAAVVDTGFKDHSVQARAVLYSAGNMYAKAKCLDVNNYAALGIADASGKLAFKAVVGGVAVQDELILITPTLSVNTVFRLDVDGLLLGAYVDGIKVYETILPAALAPATKVGLDIFGSTANQFDEFAARPL